MVSALSIHVRVPGGIPQPSTSPSTSRKLNHLFILKIDGNKVLESAKVPPESLEWQQQKQFHFTPFSNIEIVIYRKSRMFGWRKPVPVAEYNGRGMDFLDTEQELVDKSKTSRLVVKFDLVAESHVDSMEAVDEEMTQPAKVKGADAAQTVIPMAENIVLQANEQSHHTLNSNEDMLRSDDDKRNGNRVELSFSTSGTSGNATVQNAGGNIFNNNYTVHQNASKDEIDRRIALDTNARMKQAQHGLDKSKVKEWMYSADSDTSSNYNAARKVHLPGTGSWFIGGSEFAHWKAQPGSVLWLHGGPGSGKTVLSSSAIKDIIDFCNLKPLVRGYAYFFFDARNEKLQYLAHEKFIQSLISQLSDRCGDELPTALVSLFNACDRGHRQPDHTSLENTLLRLLECFEDTYIVIDSLDECAEKVDLLKWIQSVTSSKTLEGLHLMVTSRAESEIHQGLVSLSSLEKVSIIDQSTASDIYAYIAAELAKTDRWNVTEKNMITDTLFSRSGGMFRWVALQLHDVMKCRHKKQSIQQLSSLPKDLNAIYERIFERSDHPEDLQKFLQWLAFSKRDMTVTEIDEVGTVDLSGANGPLYNPDMRSRVPGTILIIGYGLVTEIDGTVKLAHFSVKEYLIKHLRSMAETQCCTSEQLSHSVIAQTCLAHLLYFDRESILDDELPGYISQNHLSFFPLARYAAEHWVYHFHSAPADCSHLLKLLLKLFTLPRSRAMVNWVRLHSPDSQGWAEYHWQSPNDIASPLYYASLSGLTELARYLINNGANINAVGGVMGRPLLAASGEGHVELAKLLLESGADVHTTGGSHGTVLIAASQGGHFELAKLLLDAGANVNIAGGSYGTALQAASAGGHLELAKLLLNAGADVNVVGGTYGTALQTASVGGHLEFAKLLLESGADVNAAGGEYGTALQAASVGGHLEFAKLLLNAGANVNAAGGWYGAALIAASWRGRLDVAKLLLDAGADVNIAGGSYGTLLIAASQGGHFELAKLLLDNGADVNVAGGYYGTALQAASAGGHVELAKLLLESRADVNAAGGTAMRVASAGGHVELVKLLLESGADVNAAGGTALRAASGGGHVELARLLLESGADVNAAGGKYGTALQAASESARGHVELAKLLLESGADVNATGGKYGTALQAASARGHVELAKLLLESGADVDAVGEEYGTALQVASAAGHVKLAELLLESGADVNAAGEYGTALQAASRKGRLDVIKLLREAERGAAEPQDDEDQEDEDDHASSSSRTYSM